MIRRRYGWGITCMILVCMATTAVAQERDEAGPSLNSPYATIRTHLYYLQPETYKPEISALAIPPSVDRARAIKLAIQLKQVLDGQGLYVRMNMLPQDQDYLDSTSMAHIYTPFPKHAPDIFLERIDSLWYYSNETIEAIPRMHGKLFPFGADLLSRRIPDALQGRFLGIAAWQYLGLLVMILGFWLLHELLSRLFRPVIKWISRHVKNMGYAEPKDVQKSAGLFSLIFVFFLVSKTFPMLQLNIRFSQFLITGISIVSAIFWMLLGLVIVRVVTRRIKAITETTESRMDDQLLPILRKLLQIAIVGAAIIYILSALDVNVTALIAGLSIGALALALAAQDTVKNLIGSIMIFIDKPFQVGDWVLMDGQEGTIIEVGFRSTRIQLLDTSIVSIPNGNVANLTITNLGVRTFRLLNILVGITYDTPPDKIVEFMNELKKFIVEHPVIHKENYLVHFREMGDFALKIIFRCYIPVATFADELQIKEEIYLEMMRIASRLGVEFAFPTQTLYVNTEEGPETPG